MEARGPLSAADRVEPCGRRGGAKGRITLPLLALLLSACASGPPTITLDAGAFVRSYMLERDQFRDRTAPARRRCATLAVIGSDTTKAKCAQLAAEEAAWAARDAAILHALLTRRTIDAETLAAVWAVAERLLVVAADIAL
jgi:hypothetical protein